MKLKNILLCGILALLTVFISACGQQNGLNKFDKPINTDSAVSMELVYTSSTTAVATVKNNGETDVWSSDENEFSLQIEENGQWYELKRLETAPTSATNIMFAAGKSSFIQFNWSDKYDALPEGHYRLVKEFTRGEDNAEHFFLGQEFDASPVNEDVELGGYTVPEGVDAPAIQDTSEEIQENSTEPAQD